MGEEPEPMPSTQTNRRTQTNKETAERENEVKENALQMMRVSSLRREEDKLVNDNDCRGSQK